MEKITQTAGRAALGTFAPDFAHFNDDILFGENRNNPDIDRKTRCIVTVVALMAQGITDSSLKYHLQNAKSNGVSQKEIAAVITHAAILPFTSRGAIWHCFIKTEAFPPIFYTSERSNRERNTFPSFRARSKRSFCLNKFEYRKTPCFLRRKTRRFLPFGRCL